MGVSQNNIMKKLLIVIIAALMAASTASAQWHGGSAQDWENYMTRHGAKIIRPGQEDPEPHWKRTFVIIKGHCEGSSHLAWSMEAATAVDNEDWPIISDMFAAYQIDDLKVGTKVGLLYTNKSGEWYLVHPLGDRDYTYWVRSDFLREQ